MKRKSIPIYVLFVVAVVFFPFTTKAQLSLDIESGAVIAGYKLLDKVALRTGYRILEGGADNDEVYNFSLFNYALVGLSITF